MEGVITRSSGEGDNISKSACSIDLFDSSQAAGPAKVVSSGQIQLSYPHLYHGNNEFLSIHRSLKMSCL